MYHCDSAIYTTGGTAALTTGSIIPLGTTNRRFGKNIRQDGNGITICGAGYYEINAAFTATGTAAGTITITMLENGVPVQGATASATVAAAGIVTLPIVALTRISCCDSAKTITFQLTGTGITINNAAVVVTKI